MGTTMLRGAGAAAKTEKEKRLIPRRLEQIANPLCYLFLNSG